MERPERIDVYGEEALFASEKLPRCHRTCMCMCGFNAVGRGPLNKVTAPLFATNPPPAPERRALALLVPRGGHRFRSALRLDPSIIDKRRRARHLRGGAQGSVPSSASSRSTLTESLNRSERR